jgi:hypothetical protein
VVTDCCWVSESEVKVSIELEAHLFRLDSLRLSIVSI